MTATAISAAAKNNIIRALDGVLPEMHAKGLHDYLFVTLPALILSDMANASQAVADVAAVKALDVGTLADRALVYVEGTGQLFAYDSGSSAVESLGPPATVIQPTSGAGRYLVFVGTTAYVDARLRLCADDAAVKALDVTTLVDKALIVKEDSGEIFRYDSGSSATEILGPPAMVIQPTSGAGRYLSMSLLEKRLRVCADEAAMKALVVGGLTDKCLVYREDTQQLFAYDSGSAAAEALGPPATVIQPTAGAGRYLALTLGGQAIPQSYFDARLRLCADATAVKALDVTTLVDKCLVYVEDIGQLFAYDSGSVAVDVTGVSIEPTAGAGAYLATDRLDRRLRVAADAVAVKALDVATLVDKCLVYVEDLRQLFAYDATSTASDVTGVSIEPTAGAGAYVALTNPPAPFTWFTAMQITDPAENDNLPAGANGTFANSNRQTQRAPCKGICKVWYSGEDVTVHTDGGGADTDTAVFKVISVADVALVTKEYKTSTPAPAAFVPGLLGSFAVAEGDVIGWESITTATTNQPKFKLQFDITPIV